MKTLRLDEKTLMFCCQDFEVCYLSYFIYLASPQLEYDTHIYKNMGRKTTSSWLANHIESTLTNKKQPKLHIFKREKIKKEASQKLKFPGAAEWWA